MSEELEKAQITIYDRQTKQSKVIEWEGYSVDFWWKEGNGSCDCNRHIYFWPYEQKSEIKSTCKGRERYIIKQVDGENVDFDEWNSNYTKLRDEK